MRKRAKIKIQDTAPSTKPVKKNSVQKKNYWVVIALVGIFISALFLNTYFNVTSEVGINPNGETYQEKFYLSGPDPYYNMRVISQTLETGRYPWATPDPLLNYPVGSLNPARPPFLNILTIGASVLFEPFLGEDDAIGYAMQFMPALFGALLVFPVYLLGKTLFGRKAGIIGAMFIPLIPIHIGSGHGSAFTLFDHDSLNLLLFTLIFLFFIKGLRAKVPQRTILYGLLAGTCLAALSMTWIEARFVYSIILVYFSIQIIVNLFRSKFDVNLLRMGVLSIATGVFIALPLYFRLYIQTGIFTIRLEYFLLIGVIGLSIIYIIINKLRIPWIITLPSLAVIATGGIGLVALLRYSGIDAIERIAGIIFGGGVYGNKVALTIAEASTYNISRTVMSFGPVLYWLAFAGFIFLIYRWVKEKYRPDYLFIMVLFGIELWFASIAGRFLNDLVPIIAILSGWITWSIIDKLDYKHMIKNMRNISGLRGIRKGIKPLHLLGICFIVFIIFIPNTYMALVASVPNTSGKLNKTAMFGGEEYTFGLGLYKETYWIDALMWLNEQDTEIEDPCNRPGFISWWDYGFYEVAVGGHPTVADNFQEGIPPAGNFHLSKTEEEAVSVLIIRLIQGEMKHNNDSVTNETKNILKKYLPDVEKEKEITLRLPNIFRRRNDSAFLEKTFTYTITVSLTEEFVNILEDPERYAPSFDTFIAPEWGNDVLRVRVENAMYHDATDIITGNLTDDEITWMYKDVQDSTGYSIRYYGVEGYDMLIFNVFSFLSDKGVHGYVTPEDDYFQTKYVDKNGDEWTLKQVEEMDEQAVLNMAPFEPKTVKKDGYYNTMVYKAYKGFKDGGYPTLGLRHFIPKYVAPYPYPGTTYPAVVISKYYMGCYINGTISVGETAYSGIEVHVLDEHGIPHDSALTNTKGEFHVISAPGNISLRIFGGGNIIQDIPFNATTGVFMPITEDEADRIGNYVRDITINLEKATLSGYIINATADTIQLNEETAMIDEEGYYEFEEIIPNQYEISVYSEDIRIQQGSIFINSGEDKTYNITIDKGFVYGYVDEPDINMTLMLGGYTVDVDNETGYYLIGDIVPDQHNLTVNINHTEEIHRELIAVIAGVQKYNVTLLQDRYEEIEEP